MNKKILISTIAALLFFSGAASASYVLKFNNSQSKGMIPAESSQGSYSSCKDILDNGKSTGDGIYSITVNNKKFDVYCDMTSAGGGWTMVVAQFEQDPVTDWNEGIQADYDPSLATNKGFALNIQEIPNHIQTAFGKNLDADYIDYTDFSYTSGDINTISVSGVNTGKNYKISRYSNYYYHYHNPDEDGVLNSTPNHWKNTLSFDESNTRGFNWAFSPRGGESGHISYSGFSMEGNILEQTAESYAWTVWVR